MSDPLQAFARSCRRNGVVPTRFVLAVNIACQKLLIFEKSIGSGDHSFIAGSCRYDLLEVVRCSTSKFGIGEQAGSNKTPRGLHQISDKIGGGWPAGAVFKSREMVGYTWKGMPMASVTTRILWLDGLEPGFNRGGEVDSHDRYIYIHGTGNELGVGRPASHGCVQLSADDLIPLYNKVPRGTLVWIAERF